MATIETKFGVGDVVWCASTATERKQHPCPDCLGSREWKCASPAGGEFTVACPRCGGGYQSNAALSLAYTVHTPSARRLTIGLVRANGSYSDPPEHEYMAHETGVGSGSVYRESSLFATEEEAMKVAKARAAVANADAEGWVAKQYAASLKFSDYELKDALIAASNTRRISAEVRYGMLLDDFRSAEDIEDVRAILERLDARAEEAA